jgi:hypothetical protein
VRDRARADLRYLFALRYGRLPFVRDVGPRDVYGAIFCIKFNEAQRRIFILSLYLRAIKGLREISLILIDLISSA